uniref:Uncharacterized protein n=1 Tax=Fagus sylvatica TaxID=28930 RepID=A0A2N9IEK4_FAGSY
MFLFYSLDSRALLIRGRSGSGLVLTASGSRWWSRPGSRGGGEYGVRLAVEELRRGSRGGSVLSWFRVFGWGGGLGRGWCGGSVLSWFRVFGWGGGLGLRWCGVVVRSCLGFGYLGGVVVSA